jgi:hypothetical protein
MLVRLTGVSRLIGVSAGAAEALLSHGIVISESPAEADGRTGSVTEKAMASRLSNSASERVDGGVNCPTTGLFRKFGAGVIS